MRTLVVFDTKHGATEEVAGKIAEGIRASGGAAVLLDLRGVGAARASMAGFDAVALGGPSYMGKWSKRASAFASAREADLAGKELALFVVGNDADKAGTPATEAVPQALAGRAKAVYFGGRIDFARLGRFERFIVKAVSGKAESSSTLDLEAARAFGSALAGSAAR